MRYRYLAAAATLILAACGGDKPTETNGTTGNTGATGNTGPVTTNQITITDNNFNPGSTTVPVGTTVTWSWNGQSTHNVTFDNGSVTGSGDRTNGDSFQKQFNAAGTYTYQCTNHYGMSGIIYVQ